MPQTRPDTPGPEACYRAHLSEGRFMLQRSPTTGRFAFYPRVIMPATGEADLEWVEASGRGTVYSTSVVRRAPADGGDHNIAIVELAEGPRTLTRVLDCAPENVRIGMAVRARIDLQDGAPIVHFVPADPGETA